MAQAAIPLRSKLPPSTNTLGQGQLEPWGEAKRYGKIWPADWVYWVPARKVAEGHEDVRWTMCQDLEMCRSGALGGASGVTGGTRRYDLGSGRALRWHGTGHSCGCHRPEASPTHATTASDTTALTTECQANPSEPTVPISVTRQLRIGIAPYGERGPEYEGPYTRSDFGAISCFMEQHLQPCRHHTGSMREFATSVEVPLTHSLFSQRQLQ